MLRILVAILLIASTASATDYYVRKDGSDSCNGTVDAAGSSGDCAKLTIQAGVNLASAGDTVYVGAGSYNTTFTTAAAGTSSNWLTIRAKAGETVTVSAASGAVGSAFGALAKARGCRVVGIAGGQDKCDYVVKELGFDACIDYKQHKDYLSLSKALREACPNGIDGHFENVGGMVLDAVMLRTNAFARIAVCGMIAGYDGAPLPMANPALILVNRMKIEGFIVSEHMEVWPQALQELGTLVGTGKLRPRESVAQGLAAAPEAFLGLLKGKNFGKQLVKLV
jgi:NADPH-dependent curcumin reductase CurA